jgi:hypothetical protein
MRWLLIAAGWLVLAPIALAQNDAQKLYQAMEQITLPK